MNLLKNKFTKTIKNHYFILLIIYVISFFPLLINNGIFWDDWTVFYVDKASLQKQLEELSLGGIKNFHFFVMSLSFGPLLIKWLAFTMFLFSSILVYEILKKSKFFDQETVLFLTLLFAVFPYNFPRATLACFHYTTCNFAFFLAFYLFVLYLKKRVLLWRILSLLFFIVSFYANSILVFFLVVFLYVGFYEKVNIRSLKDILTKYLRYADLILIPVIFWLQKKLFFATTGSMTTYNQLHFSAIINSPIEFLIALKITFLDVISDSLALSISGIFLTILLYLVFKKKLLLWDTVQKINISFFGIGLLLFFLGLFAYLAVGRQGNHYGFEWESRDQLLLPLGASFILYFGILIIQTEFNLNSKIKYLLFAIFISSFCVKNFNTYWQFNIDWLKQLSFLENIKTIPEIKDNSTFFVEDKTSDLNAIKRTYRFYEYSSLMKLAFGNENRLVINRKDFEKNFPDSVAASKLIVLPYLSIRNYHFCKPQYIININRGTANLSMINTLKIMIKQYIKPEKFRQEIKNVINVSVQKIYLKDV